MKRVSLDSVIDAINSGNQADEQLFKAVDNYTVNALSSGYERDSSLTNETLKEILASVKSIISLIKTTGVPNSKSTDSSKLKPVSSPSSPGTGLIKGLMLGITPTAVFNTYAKGINKLVDSIKKIDTGDIDKKLSVLSKLSSTIKDMGDIKWTSVIVGSFKLKQIASSYASGISALANALGKIKVSKTLEAKLKVFSRILEPLKVLQDLKLNKILLSTALLFPISKGIVFGISPLLKLTTPMLTKMAKIGKGLHEIFEPLSKFLSSITTSLIKGGLGLVLIAGSLAVAAYSLNKFADVSWESVLKGTVALGALTAAAYVIGNSVGSFVKGAVGLALLGASIIPLAYGLNMMKDVGIETVGVLAAGLLALGIAGGIFSAFIGPIMLGAVAIAALGAALIPFAYSMNLLKDVNWDNFSTAGTALLTFASGAIPLLLAVPGLIASAAGLVLFAGGVKLLNMAVGEDGGASMTSFMTSLSDLTKNVSGSQISEIALGVLELSAAVAAFGAAKAIDGIGSFFGRMLGGKNPIDELIKLAERGIALTKIGDGILNISKGLRAMSDASSGLINLANIDLTKLEALARFEDARAAGYSSYEDYKGHNFEWRTKNQSDLLQAIPSSTGVGLNQQGSINVSGGNNFNINYGGNTSVTSSSSNINTNNSIMAPALQGSALGSVWQD